VAKPARRVITVEPIEGQEENSPRVYLAGPMVFDLDPSAIFERMKTLCREQALVGVAPLDNQIGLERLPPGKPLLQQIVRADIELMERLEAAVFCLDGFRRGPEMDAGTAFEIGYMKALGKPIAGWTRDPRTYPVKVADFLRTAFGEKLVTTTAGLVGGTSGLLRDPDGVLVHSEGCVQNAMVHVGIELAGGVIVADPDWETAFRGAVASVARQLARPDER
jgi:nucleoside 2-deoxyribosyltransferase